jgi:tungstate transport system substrate-binding protein
MQTAMKGDADMILVHDPVHELKYLEDGYGVNRKVIAYNFVIVGNKNDPAGVKDLSPIEAFKKIKESGEKESALWRAHCSIRPLPMTVILSERVYASAKLWVT